MRTRPFYFQPMTKGLHQPVTPHGVILPLVSSPQTQPLNPLLPPNYAVKVFHKIKGPTAGPNQDGGRNDKEVDPAKQHIRR